ncbi:glycosyltransferase family 4 protein [Monaibacterium marinum]|nr:glycosyltransferase family 4 protein [Monaibacterium marinum]
MKILHVCETAIGGVSTYLQNFDSHTPDRVHNVFLFPEGHAQDLPDTMHHSTFASEKRGLKSIWNMLVQSRRMLRETEPDIVFFHSTFSLAALVFLRLAGWRGKGVYIAHSWAISRYENKTGVQARCVRLIEGHLCALADLVLNIGRADERLARTLGYRGVHKTLENAVAPTQELARSTNRPSIDPDRLNLLFVGRFDRQKGLDILLGAFRRTTEHRTDLALHVVGAKVRNDGGDIDLPRGVTLSGWAEKGSMDSWYAHADALVVPSRWEGLPLVIPEALRNGTPVICSRRSAMDELIEEGISGYSFDLTEDDLFEMLLSLRKSTLQTMRGNALESYQRDFTIEVWQERLTGILDELVNA